MGSIGLSFKTWINYKGNNSKIIYFFRFYFFNKFSNTLEKNFISSSFGPFHSATLWTPKHIVSYSAKKQKPYC